MQKSLSCAIALAALLGAPAACKRDEATTQPTSATPVEPPQGSATPSAAPGEVQKVSGSEPAAPGAGEAQEQTVTGRVQSVNEEVVSIERSGAATLEPQVEHTRTMVAVPGLANSISSLQPGMEVQ